IEEKLESFVGEEAEIAFNAKFLADVLANIPDETVLVEISGSTNPVVLKPAKTKGYLYIIMPLRIEE
ncbi:MAG: DNA polymerase III subunit beta, partial [Patescibacteria group bacterium]|nr:DNA polymerase III subunit beta [Patescibacteria group bacterium]